MDCWIYSVAVTIGGIALCLFVAYLVFHWTGRFVRKLGWFDTLDNGRIDIFMAGLGAWLICFIAGCVVFLLVKLCIWSHQYLC